MKLLTVTVPCYNSQEYMRHCVETLLSGGSEVEILIVDDGSTDATAEIADELAAGNPGVVRAIHQENGGHGAAIMTGLQNATGMYFKVVDSDDWVDEEAFIKVLDVLRSFVSDNSRIDLLVSNYVYDKVGVKKKKVMRYINALPQNRVLSWDDVGSLRKGQYLLMHSIIYRTQLLMECGLKLPHHTFYVDNLYACVPMRLVKRLYYLNVDFYHYFIGRSDQSVNESVMIKRIDQQIKVNKLLFQQVNLFSIENRNLRQLLMRYLEIITTVSSVLLIRSGTPENLEKMRLLWEYIKYRDTRLYHKLRYGIFGQLLNLPGKLGRDIVLTIYKMSQKAVGFN